MVQPDLSVEWDVIRLNPKSINSDRALLRVFSVGHIYAADDRRRVTLSGLLDPRAALDILLNVK